jgi:hypothetical protein
VLMLACVDSGVMSSAYAKVLTSGGGEGRSEVYKLNRIGESTPP